MNRIIAKLTAITGIPAMFFACDGTEQTINLTEVESIVIDQEDLSMIEGETITLTATVLPKDAADKSVSWSSSDDDVVMVSSGGKAMAMQAGRAVITAKAGKKSDFITITVSTKTIPVRGVSLDPPSITMIIGESQTITAEISPQDATNKSIEWSSDNMEVASVNSNGIVIGVATGTAQIRATANDGSGVYATCAVTVKKQVPEGAVHLGLSVFWAKCNLGASKPEDYGDYYAWGETEPYYYSQDPLTWKNGKTGYNWKSYSLCNGSSQSLTKYNTRNYYGRVDNKTVLEPEDDAAFVNLGGNWRMPTYEEWTELMTNCTWTWTTENGVNGRKVTGPNGNSFFLPAAGSRGDKGLSLAGTDGYYWSSSLDLEYPYMALHPSFDSRNVLGGSGSRIFGWSVRPVID